MPVFIDEVIIRANVDRPGRGAADGASAGVERLDRERLVAEVLEQVVAYLERERDRIGER